MGDAIRLRELRIAVGHRVLVDDVALDCEAGELLAVVGASGSGKTLTCRSLLGLVDLRPGVVSADLTITVDGVRHRPYWGDALGGDRRARDRAFRGLRGGVVGYLPQQAGAALDPLLRVGPQVVTAARLGGQDEDPLHWLRQAGFDHDPATVADRHPHELSGGMAQRVAIAQLLARGSRFVVADEPMTGLDAAVQQRLASRLRDLARRGLGVLVVTHDLGLVRAIADRVVLVDGGRIAERWSRDDLFRGAARTEAGRRLLRAIA